MTYGNFWSLLVAPSADRKGVPFARASRMLRDIGAGDGAPSLTGAGGQGVAGVGGGAGGDVIIHSSTGSIEIMNGSMVANGGQGGTGGDGGYGYTTGGIGGMGGTGGGGGLISATASAGTVTLGSVGLLAGGGEGGIGGQGGGGGTIGGLGGNGGAAGAGGGIEFRAGGDIDLGFGAVAASPAQAGGYGAGGYGYGQDGDDGLAGTPGGSGIVRVISTNGAVIMKGSPLTAYGGTISLYQGADLDMSTSGQSFDTGNGGTVLVATGGNMSNVSVAPFLSSPDSITLAAVGSLDLGGSLTAPSTIGLFAGQLNIDSAIDSAFDVTLGGSVVNVNAAVTTGSNVTLTGPTININASGNVTAGNNVALIAPLTGGIINLMGGVTANGLSATPSSITASNGIPQSYTGIAFVAGSLFADAGGYLHATDTAIGNISGLVTGDITLTNGANFQAGRDVDLVLAGAASTLSLLSGGYILASPTTIKLDFTNRSSGGLVMSGGGGLFVGTPGNMVPATAGAGLVLAYATTAVVDPCATNPLLCKTEESKLPTETTTPVIDTPKPDPAKPVTDPTKTTGGTEGTFGDEGDKPTQEAKKDEKKDEKDEKDKKSDEAKDEKKDEKPAQKKVAQCT